MSLSEMSLSEQKNQNNPTDDIYDDGLFASRTQELLRRLRRHPAKTAAHGVFDFLQAHTYPGSNRHGGDLWESVWGADKPLNTESLHVYIYRLTGKADHVWSSDRDHG
jgi:hypothetical protein